MLHHDLLSQALTLFPASLAEALRTYGKRSSHDASESIVEKSAHSGDLILVFAGGAREFLVSGQGEELSIGFHNAPVLLQVDEDNPLDNPRATRYNALSRVQAITLDCKYSRALERDTQVIKLVRSIEKSRLRRALRSERRLAFEPAHVRCADMLVELCTKFGVPTPGGVKIIFPFTMNELARFLNLTPRHLRRFMPQWENDGIIDKTSAELLVRDVALLKKLAAPTKSARSSVFDR